MFLQKLLKNSSVIINEELLVDQELRIYTETFVGCFDSQESEGLTLENKVK